MKYGVLTFGYAGLADTDAARVNLLRHGVNLGDNVQTLAMRRLLGVFGIAPGDIIDVDRDSLSSYDGPPVRLPLNACMGDHAFPLSPNVHPVFIGFQAKPATIAAQADLLRRHAPIGCRDVATARACRALGIAAEVTGCVSLTLPRRKTQPRRPCVMVVQGALAGRFPGEALLKMPADLLARAEFVHQRRLVARLPLAPQDRQDAEDVTAALLRDYHDRATLVVTPLHHAAAPCMAMGIPVVVVRRKPDPRFSLLETLLPVHLPPFDALIDWSPAPVDVAPVARRYVRRLRQALGLGAPSG